MIRIRLQTEQPAQQAVRYCYLSKKGRHSVWPRVTAQLSQFSPSPEIAPAALLHGTRRRTHCHKPHMPTTPAVLSQPVCPSRSFYIELPGISDTPGYQHELSTLSTPGVLLSLPSSCSCIECTIPWIPCGIRI